MKVHFGILTAAALFAGGGLASAQQMQYDSLGSPTPSPNQGASPNASAPNVPTPNPTGQGGSIERPAASAKTNANSPATTGQGNVSAGNAGTDTTNGLTPGGLTPD